MRHEIRKEARELSVQERFLTRLTDTTIRIFEELTHLARACKGELFPSYETLAARTARSRNSVWRAIGLLEALGFICRQRRFKKIKAEGPGAAARTDLKRLPC